MDSAHVRFLSRKIKEISATLKDNKKVRQNLDNYNIENLDNIDAIKKNLEKLLYENDGKPQNPHDATCDFLVKFLEDPLYDDLNTPGYIANLHKLYEKSQKGDLKDKEVFISACNFVGLLNVHRNKWEAFKKSKISKKYTFKI